MVVDAGLPAETNEPVEEAAAEPEPLAPPAVEFAASVLNGATLDTVADTFAGVLLFPLKLINCPPNTPSEPGTFRGALAAAWA